MGGDCLILYYTAVGDESIFLITSFLCGRLVCSMPPQVQIEFHRDKVAKAVGSLARELGAARRAHGASRRREAFDVQGLLVNERFTKRLMAPSDLDEYTLVRDIFEFIVIFSAQWYLLRDTGGVLMLKMLRSCCREGNEGSSVDWRGFGGFEAQRFWSFFCFLHVSSERVASQKT